MDSLSQEWIGYVRRRRKRQRVSFDVKCVAGRWKRVASQHKSTIGMALP